jgi:hypothetical protein
MTDVTVQLADLERIIFAASVIKPIENALAAFKNDPFVKPHLAFGEAAKRLEEAMRRAQRSAASARGDTLVDYNAPPDETEMELLRSLFEKTDGGMTFGLRRDRRSVHLLGWVSSEQPSLLRGKGGGVGVTPGPPLH